MGGPVRILLKKLEILRNLAMLFGKTLDYQKAPLISRFWQYLGLTFEALNVTVGAQYMDPAMTSSTPLHTSI